MLFLVLHFFLTMMTRSHGGYVFPVVKAEVRDLGSWITFLTPFDTTHHLIASLPIYLPSIQVGCDNISTGMVVKKQTNMVTLS